MSFRVVAFGLALIHVSAASGETPGAANDAVARCTVPVRQMTGLWAQGASADTCLHVQQLQDGWKVCLSAPRHGGRISLCRAADVTGSVVELKKPFELTAAHSLHRLRAIGAQGKETLVPEELLPDLNRAVSNDGCSALSKVAELGPVFDRPSGQREQGCRALLGLEQRGQ